MPETFAEGAAGPATKTPPSAAEARNLGQGAFTQVPIEIVVSVGRARPQVRDLLRLGRDSVLTLDRRVEDPVELFVGDRLIARGVLEELEGEQAGNLAVRLTEVADLTSGL
jgi:flagellar motor switch protein FliN/FliY